MNRQFIISGRRRLEGKYQIQGNKNAALPLISAALLTHSKTILRKVPKIADVANLLRLVEALGVQVKWKKNSLILDARGLRGEELPAHLVKKLRGSVLLLGSIAPNVERVFCAELPGGCPIGNRSFDMHWKVFRSAGFSVKETPESIELRRERSVSTPKIYMEESSVTATENALLLFAALGRGIIENPAREPHVFSLVDFLRMLGCKIELHPLCFEVKKGITVPAKAVEFEIPPDYVDIGTIAIAAAVTDGRVSISGVSERDLLGIQTVLESFGIRFEKTPSGAFDLSAGNLVNPSRVTAGPWPLFPTDLVSLAIVLATQGKGFCLVHDWMYEARMFFVDKLSRMGARITMCDPHRVLVEGRSPLRGVSLESPDIRAGMAMVVAGLCAEGTTTIEHAEVILRGYEDVVGRLHAVGADISEDIV
jgi:UDP-N-acetylglucosamine 1-carboxyvinyltransferase